MNLKKIHWYPEIAVLVGAISIALSAPVQIQAEPGTPHTCSAAQDSMSALIDSYLPILKSCYYLKQEGQQSSQLFREKADEAREIETRYARAVQLCKELCSNANSCTGAVPNGACELRRR